MASNWPLTSADLLTALQEDAGQEDDAELTLFITAACEKVDEETGRDVDPTRYVVGDAVPTIFILAARETAKLWWKQTKNGGRGRPNPGEVGGPPAGADLPSKVKGWLAKYPPRLFIPDPPT